MRAICLTVSNPFDPMGSRQMRSVRRPARIRALQPAGTAPRIAILNGRPILRAEWRRKLRDGDQLMFAVLPRGGGGGGGSNPMRALLSLALMAFAPWAAGAVLGSAASSVLFGTFTVGQATSLGIIMAGQAAINALMPTPRATNMPSPSPTYSIGAQGNQARIEQAIPAQYGRLLAWPDLAAQPYTEYAGNEQYLFQLLCLGVGEYDIEEIRIEDTPISAFTEVESEIIAPGGQVTLFPTNVISSVEVSGQELTGRKSGTYSQSGTTITVTETGHGRVVGQAIQLDIQTGSGVSGYFNIATAPTADTFTVTAAAALTASGDTYIRSLVGGVDGFLASEAGTIAQSIAIDVVFPLGLFLTDGSGDMVTLGAQVIMQAMRVDDNGLPIGSWTTLATEIINDRTVTPQARSFRYALPVPGRYRVRAWRQDTKQEGTDRGHQMIWAGLRAYLSETQDFGPVTLIAMRMRATNNLSAQASRRIGVLATRKLPVWNGTTWATAAASRSIAWAIADAARDADYGAGLADTAIDLDALLALDAIWTARGDTFDGRFDQSSSWWEAVSKIAMAGRSQIFMQGGKLRIVRDGEQTLPVALFSMRNIKRGSFSIDYMMPSDATADALDVSYFDQVTWSPRRVRAALSGSTMAKPVKMELFGVTQRAQALREGLYHAAANKYRRRFVRFTTEMEGFIPSLGDLIAIQHDMPAWGAHAEAVAWNAGTLTLTVTEPMTFGVGTHYIGLRTATGGLSGPWEVTAGATAYDLVLTETPDMTPYTGGDRERTHVVFGAGQTWRTLAKVATAKPRGLHEVAIEAVIEDPSVHTAETGVVADPIITSALPRAVTQPVVAGLMARLMPDDATRAVLAWRPAAGADVYQVEMASGTDIDDPDVNWTRTADTSATNHVIALLYASQTLIRVRGIGLAAGPWTAAALGSLLYYMWTTDDALLWTGDSNPMWSS
jgi:hypothetical protein